MQTPNSGICSSSCIAFSLFGDNGSLCFSVRQLLLSHFFVFVGEDMANTALSEARNAKNDEFYTQYEDIQREINAYLEYDPDVFRNKTILLPCDDPEWSNFTRFFAQNFEAFGLKKLISTSFAHESKNFKGEYQLSLFEEDSPEYDETKTLTHGKIFTLTRSSKKHPIDLDDLQWHYLEGDGDFRSDEVKVLRDEADMIVTNPPFSLFREFLAWVMEAKKEFVIIGNMNAITYKEVFPLLMANEVWLGNGFHSGNAYFRPAGKTDYASGVYDEKTGLVKFRNCCWFTNIEHGRRHQPLTLMTMDDNIKFSKHKEIKNIGYAHYDNYNAIEVPYTDAIPSDYPDIMGVPVSFMDKYCPEQFEIIGATESEGKGFSNGLWDETSRVSQPLVHGERVYKRVFIRKRVQA